MGTSVPLRSRVSFTLPSLVNSRTAPVGISPFVASHLPRSFAAFVAPFFSPPVASVLPAVARMNVKRQHYRPNESHKNPLSWLPLPSDQKINRHSRICATGILPAPNVPSASS